MGCYNPLGILVYNSIQSLIVHTTSEGLFPAAEGIHVGQPGLDFQTYPIARIKKEWAWGALI